MRTVLIIEDEEHIREVAELSLASVAGWDVLQAAGGEDGLAIARDQRPDAILLDVMMPDMDGPTTLAQLQHDPDTADIPVIFLTAKLYEPDRNLADTPARGVIAKPFEPMELARHVADLLGWDL